MTVFNWILYLSNLKSVGWPASNFNLNLIWYLFKGCWFTCLQLAQPGLGGGPAKTAGNVSFSFYIFKTFVWYLFSSIINLNVMLSPTQAAARAPRKQNLGPLSDISQQVSCFLLPLFSVKISSRMKKFPSRSLHCGRQSHQDWPEISSRTQSSLRQKYVAWCYFWHDSSSLYLLGERPLSSSKSWGGPKREAETGTHDKGLKSNQIGKCMTESNSGTRCSDSGCQFWLSASWWWGRRGEGEGPAKGSREGFSRGEDKQVGPNFALLFQNLHHICFCRKRNSEKYFDLGRLQLGQSSVISARKSFRRMWTKVFWFITSKLLTWSRHRR